jgi:hypothetical protein
MALFWAAIIWLINWSVGQETSGGPTRDPGSPLVCNERSRGTMNALKALAAVLAIAVVGLSISLGVVLARGGDDQSPSSGYSASDTAVAGMIGAMQAQDWNGMFEYMRQYMGDGHFQGMMGWWTGCMMSNYRNVPMMQNGYSCTPGPTGTPTAVP